MIATSGDNITNRATKYKTQKHKSINNEIQYNNSQNKQNITNKNNNQFSARHSRHACPGIWTFWSLFGVNRIILGHADSQMDSQTDGPTEPHRYPHQYLPVAAVIRARWNDTILYIRRAVKNWRVVSLIHYTRNKAEQVALLLQRGRAMLCACQ